MANHQARGAQAPTPQPPQTPKPLVRWVGAYVGEDGKHRVIAATTLGPLPDSTLIGGVGDILDCEHNLKVGMVTKVLGPLEDEG